MKGKHTAPGRSTFLRDLSIMIAGILAVGLLVFGGLWLLSGSRSEAPGSTTTLGAMTTTTTGLTTTSEGTTSTSTTMTTTTTTTASEVRDPSEVRVLVLNAVGISGIAGRVSEELVELGYEVLTPGNYGPALERTRVWYRSGYAAEGFELAAQFPNALVELNDEVEGTDANIIVVIGASYEE